MAEELGYAAGGEGNPMEVEINFHLPLPGQPRLTDVCAWRAPALTKQGNRAIYFQIDEWVNRYGMNNFCSRQDYWQDVCRGRGQITFNTRDS